jgi:amino acid transporter
MRMSLIMAGIKHIPVEYTSDEKTDIPVYDISEGSNGVVIENVDDLQRRLSGRQIQMITIGGSIGTALFVSIGSGLVQSGPGSLLIAFFVYCVWLAAVNNCMAEMTVSSAVLGWIRSSC